MTNVTPSERRVGFTCEQGRIIKFIDVLDGPTMKIRQFGVGFCFVYICRQDHATPGVYLE